MIRRTPPENSSPPLLDTFGLSPFEGLLPDALAIVRGRTGIPPVEFGPSSLRVFKPVISLPTWLGRRRPDRRIPIYNLFNRVPVPGKGGYSVRVTHARDFQGGQWTYDSHTGTDFAIPVGTTVVAAAAGRVARVVRFFDNGGLKVVVDHGRGLVTTSDHLSRALVHEGDRVGCGQPLGLSGASGIEFVVFFPWVSPHLHFNVWLNGEPVDPFAIPGSRETSLWRHGNDPRPAGPGDRGERYEPTPWNGAAVDRFIAGCRDPVERRRLGDVRDPGLRPVYALVSRLYGRAAFGSMPSLHRAFPREPRLCLPFESTDFQGVLLPRRNPAEQKERE